MVETRRDRQKGDRRARIEDAALFLFRRQGIEATTVQEITDRADLAKGTFFNYYENKHDVLATRLRRLAGGFLGLAELDEDLPADRRLGCFFERVETLFRAEGEKLLPLYTEVLVRPHLVAMDREVEAKVLDFYADMFRQGVGRGMLRADLDARLAAQTVNDIWASTLRSWTVSGGAWSLGDAMGRKIDLLFSGCRA